MNKSIINLSDYKNNAETQRRADRREARRRKTEKALADARADALKIVAFYYDDSTPYFLVVALTNSPTLPTNSEYSRSDAAAGRVPTRPPKR